MLAIEMLPANDGDCLWIEYGPKDLVRRILIDGGREATAAALRKRIEQIEKPEDRRFELLIVTHVDSDHIAGILKLLQDPPEGLFFKQAWFNAYPQLAAGMLGPKEGEFLAVHFDREEKLRPGFWNGSFGGKAVEAPEDGDLPTFTFDGDLKVTVLAPGRRALLNLRKEWKKVVQAFFTPGDVDAAAEALKRVKKYRPGFLGGIDVKCLANTDFEEDTSEANGSSIVTLLEYDGHRCLLAADTFPSTLTSAFARLPGNKGGRVNLSLVKSPHHSSMKNNSNQLYKMIDCPRYLISTNGDRHSHPHPAGVARILANKRGPADLYFNYLSDFNKMWLDGDARNAYTYTPHYPDEGKSGLRVEL
jgi:beta-lactamase superfamily II metal-dependent hydrolase